jgi:RNA polymerase-binding transcription factor DksA
MIDTQQHKQTLDTELLQITHELKELGIQNPEISSDWISTQADPLGKQADPNMRADQSEDWQERRGTLAALETRFNNITLALQKITDGTYGVCEIAGGEIEEERLAVNASARTCKAHLENEPELSV